MIQNFYLYHKPLNRVLIKGYCGNSQDYTCTLDIAESTWWKVSNNVSRKLVGKGYYKGKAIKTIWYFQNEGSFTISTANETVIFTGKISDITEKN